jgi:diguanylate cyclase (GGDEF)-like protein
MADHPLADGKRHFSGINVRIVVEFLERRFGSEVLQRVFDEAGETRPVEVLMDDAEWASYGQVRLLFEAVSSVLGGPHWLREAASQAPIESESSAEIAQTLQDLGSPGVLLQVVVDAKTAFGMSTIRVTVGEEIGPGEWLLRDRFVDGFEAFPEYCAFTAGMLALLPRLFGLASGEVVEETCCCTGDAVCTFRLGWQDRDDDEQQRGYFQTRSRLLEARLQTLQQTVSSLVAAPDPDTGLARVLEAAAHAMSAPSYVFATDPHLSIRQRLLYQGLDDDQAERIAAELGQQSGQQVRGRLVVDVASNRSRYGWMAAVDPGSRRFVPHEEEILRSYAGLAAAALDSATALEEARREAETSAALLELAAYLAGMSTPGQMAIHIAEAVLRVLDCDRSLVFLVDPDGEVRISAAAGFSERVELQLRDRALPRSIVTALGTDLKYHDETEVAAFCAAYDLPTDEIPVASASAPIIANGDLMGGLVVSVVERAARLKENDGLNDTLRGIAGQGAMALDNARLITRIRHQALHDGLTGLANRTLMIERLEQALARAAREGHAVAAMFIDLDGFKEINDTLGHAAGDRLLRELGARFAKVLRSGDSVGRIGGDEFVAVLEGNCLAAGPEAIAERLMGEVRKPFDFDGVPGGRLKMTASIGIAVGERSSADEMLRDADIALYRAKASGKDCHVVYVADVVPAPFPSGQARVAPAS